MNEKQIRNALIGVCWILSSILIWMVAGDPINADRDLKMTQMLLKTKQCNLAGTIGADWQGGKVRITCWSEKVFEQRRPRKQRRPSGNKPTI